MERFMGRYQGMVKYQCSGLLRAIALAMTELQALQRHYNRERGGKQFKDYTKLIIPF